MRSTARLYAALVVATVPNDSYTNTTTHTMRLTVDATQNSTPYTATSPPTHTRRNDNGNDSNKGGQVSGAGAHL